MSDDKKDYFLWIDLETTGLDPNTCSILECAAVLTDFQLETVATFHQINWCSDNHRRQANAYVQQMHTDNGLWDECHKVSMRTNNPVTMLAHLKEFILVHCGVDNRPVPAGSTIHFDMRFINSLCEERNVELPLHYRMFDCRTLQTAIAQWLPNAPRFPKADAHRAMEDIQETLRYARQIRDLMQNVRVPSTYEGFQ